MAGEAAAALFAVGVMSGAALARGALRGAAAEIRFAAARARRRRRGPRLRRRTRPKARARPRRPVRPRTARRPSRVRRRRLRNRFRRAIRRLFRLRRGQHRRHIVSDRYVRSFASKLDAKTLKRLGYDPRKLGGLRRARRRYARDIFNDPRNLWVGPGKQNMELGRRWREGPPNWDFPPKGYRRPKGWERLIPRRRRRIKLSLRGHRSHMPRPPRPVPRRVSDQTRTFIVGLASGAGIAARDRSRPRATAESYAPVHLSDVTSRSLHITRPPATSPARRSRQPRPERG